jgi:hypothetical protein
MGNDLNFGNLDWFSSSITEITHHLVMTLVADWRTQLIMPGVIAKSNQIKVGDADDICRCILDMGRVLLYNPTFGTVKLPVRNGQHLLPTQLISYDVNPNYQFNNSSMDIVPDINYISLLVNSSLANYETKIDLMIPTVKTENHDWQRDIIQIHKSILERFLAMQAVGLELPRKNVFPSEVVFSMSYNELYIKSHPAFTLQSQKV